jgi:hypothetical protein
MYRSVELEKLSVEVSNLSEPDQWEMAQLGLLALTNSREEPSSSELSRAVR